MLLLMLAGLGGAGGGAPTFVIIPNKMNNTLANTLPVQLPNIVLS